MKLTKFATSQAIVLYQPAATDYLDLFQSFSKAAVPLPRSTERAQQPGNSWEAYQTNDDISEPSAQAKITVVMPPPTWPNVPALPSTSFYTISHSSTFNLQTHLDTLLATLTSTIQTLLATWAARVGTLPDKDFQTLDSAVKILQTHQPDPTIVCPLLGELGDPVTPETRIIALSQLVQFALHQFSAAGGRTRNSIPETHETGSISHTPRSATVTSSCRTRDGNMSILSACPFPLEVAHIIPRAAGNIGGGAFWWLVDMFLGVGGAEELRVFAFGDSENGLGRTDTVANTMCLSSSEHELFDRGMWEIVPLLDGVLPYAASTCAEYSARIGFLSKKPLGLATYITTPDGGARITGEIMDGHLIKLQTPNPAELPLPHPLLLQLHSVFARILHLKASAGYPETESSEGSAGLVGNVVEVDPDEWAQRLTRWLLALGKVGREERVDGWVESVPLEVVEVPENEMLEQEVQMAPGVEEKEQGDEEKEEEGEEYVEHDEPVQDDASSQWQTPTPATSTYVDQRASNKKVSLGEVEEAGTAAVGRETCGGRAEG